MQQQVVRIAHWSVVSGRWVSGQWSVGQWSLVSGRWVSGRWVSGWWVIGHWSVVGGHWSVVSGRWVSGRWVIRRLVIGQDTIRFRDCVKTKEVAHLHDNEILHTAVCSAFQILPTRTDATPSLISTLPTQKLHRNWGFLSVTHF